MPVYSQKWHNGTLGTEVLINSDGIAAIQPQLNNLGREIKKVNKKVYADQVGCEQCKGGGYRATTLGFYQRNNTNRSYQERRQSMEETLSKLMGESGKRHEENSNLIKEIRASTDAALRNQGASIKTLEIQIGQMSKVTYQEYRFGNFAVLEDMDTYHDEEMGDVIFGEPFLREVRINARQFEEMITIHNDPAITKGEQGRYDEWNLAIVPKAQEFLQGGLELRTRICPRCEDGRMAHTRANKRA
ncbi:hypothetical protein Tco_0964433 [Tanacetum coccineum]